MTLHHHTGAWSYQPIHDMQFKGLHWIEASAGTGKTYTLSSLMVRILLGAYLPNQIIATTFTRAAAAELKHRIRLRLVETLNFLVRLQSDSQQQIQQHLQHEKDPLFQKVLQDYAPRIDYAKERLKLVIDQLDELFVGTLDSFTQTILREFAFESGKIESAQITEDAKAYTDQLIHDVLREWIQHQPQQIIDYLLLQQKLKSIDQYRRVVEQSLNFSSAHFQEIPCPNIDIAQFEAAIDAVLQLDMTQIDQLSDYYLIDGAHYTVVAKKWRNHNLLQQLLCVDLGEWLTALKEQRSYAVFSPQFSATVKALMELSCKKVLNKCAENILLQFNHHPLIVTLRQFFEQFQQLVNHLEHLDSHLKFYLSQQVKYRLPSLLHQKGETTFSQQIRNLSEALQGVQGQRLAQFIHTKYPLILVDEFQDTNQDQDDVLARIWRDRSRYWQGCMIMVGDPKQAIYGFRGGDMLTYNKARQDVLAKQGHCYSLKYNHRSVAELVQVVDALFQRQTDFGEDVFYHPVAAGRQHPPLVDTQGNNHLPLRWLMLEDKADEAIQVAWQIRDLLNQSLQGQLYIEHATEQQPIIEDDIAILSKNHDALDKVQYELERLAIRVNRPSKKSVFDSQVAKDVGALLIAIMNPYDEEKVKRALLSRLFNFDLAQLIACQHQPEGLSQYIADFDLIREMWLEKGFVTAWQFTLNLFHVWQNLVASQSRDNERNVVNLRHITDILNQHSEAHQGVQNLYDWYLKQLQSPSEREWELERKLSNAAGIQLMTIHQSKGLEYKIVFLLGANKAFREPAKTLNFSTQTIINPATQQTEPYRVVTINDKALLSDQAQQQHQSRAEAEQHRLWYVALTRASYRVYVLLNQQDAQSLSGLAFWRGHGTEIFQHLLSGDEPALTQRPAQYVTQVTIPQQLSARPFPQQRFYPRSKTSFSALSQHLSHQQAKDALAALTEQQSSATDEINIVLTNEKILQQPLDWIKQHFPMGTVAGNFLHEIFQHIDFQNATLWSLEIHRRFKNDYPALWAQLCQAWYRDFPDHTEQQLIELIVQWLHDVLETPLYPHFKLKHLDANQYLTEFPFQLALADHVLSTQRIHQLFIEHGIYMLELNQAQSARYLTGSIDLVFFDGQKYYIADYKSNFLGNEQSDYGVDAIQNNMSQASYWLQAALYLVALHRYLTVQLVGYNIDQHLGGAIYLYLRGMNAEAGYGYYYWPADKELILRLDALLGHQSRVSLNDE
ncbi:MULTISPECIES: UvrD-helicase domain-containing protein [unclassified Acinetobacter]|uniref:UvrD-helicase domain-containing protein n=1 Tax=unclassified Acinetobacter TaxID=196816 RepID=UPI00293528B7|nr:MULTISPECIES: UvrD-helicase domain-containing protein [unclassified Acinetobacter]WOE30587.1 UvrD-helicase domain-containing protein [Acinetobacter sp. SAAs470]WOE38779.1 UvrD-helicase domain-containing protein [Acinetobacter sp. SAAs474]